MFKFHSICRQAYYSRISQNMKHRESIFKDNLDIKRVLQKRSVPFMKVIKDKLENNRKKLTLFFIFCGILNIQPAYTLYLQYFPSLQIQRRLREVILGPQDFESIREIQFKNKLKLDLMKEFSIIDRDFKFGFSRRLIIKALQGMEIFPSKVTKKEFYRNSGYIDKVKCKVSSVNLKELQVILESTYQSSGQKFQNFEQFQQKFLEAVKDIEIEESKFQSVFQSPWKQFQQLQPNKLPLRLKYELMKGKPEYSRDQMTALKKQMSYWAK